MITFRELTLNDAELIMNWRLEKHVATFMNNECFTSIEDQKKWIAERFHLDDYYHWIIQYNKQDVGFIYLADLDPATKTMRWGFYIGDTAALGIGGIVPPYFYHFCFSMLPVSEITAQVFYSNINVVKLHLLHGYVFCPEDMFVFEKNSETLLMIVMKLSKEKFLASRFSKHQAKLPTLHWKAKSSLLLP